MASTTSTKGKLARNFTQTPEANDIVEEAKNKGENVSKFISRCIVEYGPVLLGDKEGTDKNAPLAARLKYLEETVAEWAYDDITGEDGWGTAKIKAHQEILKSVGKKPWHSDKNITAIMAAAAANAKTAKTKPHVWQTLLRRRKDFLAR